MPPKKDDKKSGAKAAAKSGGGGKAKKKVRAYLSTTNTTALALYGSCSIQGERKWGGSQTRTATKVGC